MSPEDDKDQAATATTTTAPGLPDHLEASVNRYLWLLVRNRNIAQDKLNDYYAFLAAEYRIPPDANIREDGLILRPEPPADSLPNFNDTTPLTPDQQQELVAQAIFANQVMALPRGDLQ